MGHGIPNIFTETKQVEQERKGVMRTISLQKQCGSDLVHTATHRQPLCSCLQVFLETYFNLPLNVPLSLQASIR